MRICFVGPSNSAHIQKWCRWFAAQGYEVHVVSFSDQPVEGTKLHYIDAGVDPNGSDLGKLKYLLTGNKIRKAIRSIQQDIVNVHYATSYGVAVALSGLRNYILSVWGADIYDFPKKSILHKLLLEFSLKRATQLFSTSQAMANEASEYTDKPFKITPFGVDTELFSPKKRTRRNDDAQFIVGTVKALSDKYGIRNILEAAAELREKKEIPIVLRIAGKGPQEKEYHELAKKLGISDITSWLGFISQEAAAVEWANMDVAVVPSTLESESFGVSAVEAQACGTAVIISDIPGLMEATSPGKTSLVIPRNDSYALASALEKLYDFPEMRKELGKAGRQYVVNRYEINCCFKNIELLFIEFKNRTKG